MPALIPIEVGTEILECLDLESCTRCSFYEIMRAGRVKIG